jgi:5-oxoprolinase (ATP-hydrolysing)
MNTSWRIFVDTGGTFTDCIAYDPDQNVHRVKVLSHSALRGTVARAIGSRQWVVQLNWEVKSDIFAGYRFRSLKTDFACGVIALDPETKVIQLATESESDLSGQDFEISAGEEAPILAARLLTQTRLDEPLPPIAMRLGSTKGTNALLERKGARVGLFITQGLKDLLTIGTQQRPDLFALNVQKTPPLYEKVWEVPERMDAKGEVLEPLAPDFLDAIQTSGDWDGIDAFAVALLHSYRNPAHEQQLQSQLHQHTNLPVSVSAHLAPEIKLLPRAQTAVVNAYLTPVLHAYLQGVQSHLPAGALQVMSSAGGLVGAAYFEPKDSLLSGPAGGVVGAAWAAERSGFSRILTFDMGGTSTDVARYAGQYEYQYEVEVGGAQLLSPSMAIHTVAAGGGSICSFDGEKLQVGPESAGAFPGPACYGAGGPLTITDVNLLLGHLEPESFALPISESAARTALLATKGETEIEDEVLLRGFLRIANEKMAAAIRNISVRKGFHPPDHALLSFGGAGGQHACALADLLEIEQLVIPYDASILSACGMEKAVLERFATGQVLRPYRPDDSELDELVNQLSQRALAALQQEAGTEGAGRIHQVWLNLRLQGQESSLEVPYQRGQDARPYFRERYEQLYGHWLEGREIELVSVRVSAVLENHFQPSSTVPPLPHAAKAERTHRGLPVYLWEHLKPGARIVGPALLVSEYTTVYLENNWELTLDEFQTALLHKKKTLATREKQEIDSEAVQLELFTHRFRAIAEEMGALLERTSFSVNVKERLDFSCALLDAAGNLVVNAPHIPVHLGSLGLCVRKVSEVLTLGPGDVAITNHPGYGGSHLPDITLIRAVFSEQGERIGYVANRAHHAEIGGSRPGSMPPNARTLIEEGVVLEPQYLVRNGEVQWEAISARLQNAPFPTRALDENIADLNAGLASLQIGVIQLQSLAATFGSEQVQYYMNRLQAYASHCLMRSLEPKAGLYEAREELDDGSPLAVRLVVQADQVQIDFNGSATVHPGNLNANDAIVSSAVMYVLRLLLKEDIPLNEGLMQNVALHLPNGMLNPVFSADPGACPAVVGGNVETSQRLVDTMLKALGLAACSQGTMNNLLFGNDDFGYYETICGGTGAGPGFQGCDAVHQHMTNTRITDPEIMELRYPVRLERFAIRAGSGGEGKWTGGNGVIRQIRFLESVALTILSQHRKVIPYGSQGGKGGKRGKQYVIRADGKRVDLLGIDACEMENGDRFIIETPGGGGWGESN